MNNQDKVLTVKEIIIVLFKRRQSILVITISALITGLLVSLLMPPLFQSDGRLLVRRFLFENEKVPLLQDQPRVAENFRQLNQEDELNTVIAIIQSRDLVKEIVQDRNLTKEELDRIRDYRKYVRWTYQFCLDTLVEIWNETKYFLHLSTRPTPEEIKMLNQEKLIERVLKALVVNQVSQSDAVSIGFKCSDPELSRDFANEIIRRSRSWQEEKRGQPGIYSFYQNQVDESKGKLEAIEKSINDVRSDLNLIGAEERKSLLIAQWVDANAKFRDALERKESLLAGIGQLKITLNQEPEKISISEDVNSNPIWDKLAQNITELKIKRAESINIYNEQTKEIRDIDKLLEEESKLFDSTSPHVVRAKTMGVNLLHQNLRQQMLTKTAELDATLAEIDQIQKNSTELENEIKNLDQQIYRINALEQQKAIAKNAYEMYLKNAEMARLDDERQRAQLANLVIIQESGLPLKPLRPRKWMYMGMALAAGLIIAIAWNFTLELNDTTYSNQDELLLDFDTPILGTIRKI